MTNLDPACNRGRRAEQTVNGGPPPSGDKAAAAAYIAEMSSTLAALARGYDIETLGYLLELARLEAETISAQSGSFLSLRASGLPVGRPASDRTRPPITPLSRTAAKSD